MADKLTLLELHLHAEDNEFNSDMELSSDIGDLLRRRLGFGGASDEETETESSITDLTPEVGSETTADGGDTVQVDEDEDSEGDGSGAVVEIDADADVGEEEEDEDESSGASKGEILLFVVLLGIGLALLARRYSGVDDLEDEFEEL